MRLSFIQKENDIYPELRPLFKISQIILILGISSRAGKSSLIRLHFFNYALANPERREEFLSIKNKDDFGVKIWNIDPILNHALTYAIGESLIEYQNNKYSLTSKGAKFMQKIVDSKLFLDDIEYLTQLGKSITEATINSIVEGWG